MSDTYDIAESKRQRLGVLRRILQTAARVLLGSNDTGVKIAKYGPAAAWSDGKDITLNSDKISLDDMVASAKFRGLCLVHGLFFHEMSHLLWSPRRGTTMGHWLQDNKRFFSAYNMLEDQRIETLTVARYPSTAKYLSAMMVRWLLDTPENVVRNYPLVRGRKYLPVEVRRAVREAFSSPELIPVIIEIVDEYRLLVFPRDYTKAQALIQRFYYEVLLKMQGEPESSCDSCNSKTGSPSLPSQGRPQSQKEQDKAAQQAAEEESGDDTPEDSEPEETVPDETPEEEESGTGESGTGTEGEAPSAGAGNDGAGSGTDEDPDLDSEDDVWGDNVDDEEEAGEVDEEAPQSHESDGGYSGDKTPENGTPPKDLTDILEDALNSILEDGDVEQEMSDKAEEMEEGDGEFDTQIKDQSWGELPVTDDMEYRLGEVSNTLRALMEACEPWWERETPAGRFNIQRAMNGVDIDTAFDRWVDGDEGNDMEVVICVDNSYSMNLHHNDRTASEGTYILARALKELGAEVTVIVFDDKTYSGWRREEEISRSTYRYFEANENTNPTEALREARRIFTTSLRKSKVLITVSDGQWSSIWSGESEECEGDRLIALMGEEGVVTACCFLNGSHDLEVDVEKARKNYGHNAQVFAVLASGDKVLDFAESVVAGVIEGSASHHND